MRPSEPPPRFSAERRAAARTHSWRSTVPVGGGRFAASAERPSRMTFSFRQSEQERIAVDVLHYERAPVGEYHDDNWLTT